MENYGKVMTDAPVVETTYGKIRGENRNGVAIFRGIPYGGNCDGERRFLPPVKPEAWEEIRDCTVNGPIAVQFGTSISGSGDFGAYFSGGRPELFGCDKEVQSENCLVLNVLTPGIDAQKRPVVVYIHGGGFASGSGTLVLGADKWCREEDMVVVGINHRLNVFGALYLGDLDPAYADSGMAGMLDCVLALEWVRDNIEAFGGDPAQVTIMGESGGGGKVNNLMAMKCAQGLFKKAIVESGSGAPGRSGREEGTRLAKALLAELKIPETDIKKLLEVPAERILEATGKIGAFMQFSPIGDDRSLPYNPEGKYQEIDPSLPLLVGASLEEIAAFAEPMEDYTWEQLREDLLEPARAAQAAKEAQEKAAAEGKKLWSPDAGRKSPALRGVDWINEKNLDEVIAAYREANPKADAQHVFYEIGSMGSFLGAGAFEQAMAKAKEDRGKVYHYFVTFQAPHPRYPNLKFAWHTADLPLQMRIVGDPGSEKLSKAMGHAWGAFIRTGNPSTEELEWPEFDTQNRKTMILDDTCHVEEDPTKAYREITKKAQAEA